MSDVLLTLLSPPGLEEALLDQLLLSGEVQVFTSAATAAYGLAFGRLSSNEQVLGRTDAVQVQAVLAQESVASLVNDLRRRYAGAGLRFWLTPVLESGEIQ
jgi:hypothetical protein